MFTEKISKCLNDGEKHPRRLGLPKGLYIATQIAYTIEILYNGNSYFYRTENGIRGKSFVVVNWEYPDFPELNTFDYVQN